jgi:MinD superfamily P-loop ATPase
MKQLVVISGKGGTGKTVIVTALASLIPKKIIADCDVDAPNVSLLLNPTVRYRNEFWGGKKPVIDSTLCYKCGRCKEVCRFSAILADYSIDYSACEGCGFCCHACPFGAITMEETLSGELIVSDSIYGPLVHATLFPGEENSGKLVTLVRNKAREIAENEDIEWIIIDGSPGIGCPVIASLSGTNIALVVTEPTISGLHDMDRVIHVAHHFGVSVRVIINKYDLNQSMSEKIVAYCCEHSLPVIGKIPFDTSIIDAMIEGKTIFEYPYGNTAKELCEIWNCLHE